jgi:hypothetical protein
MGSLLFAESIYRIKKSVEKNITFSKIWKDFPASRQSLSVNNFEPFPLWHFSAEIAAVKRLCRVGVAHLGFYSYSYFPPTIPEAGRTGIRPVQARADARAAIHRTGKR